jgi:hypothetical protein
MGFPPRCLKARRPLALKRLVGCARTAIRSREVDDIGMTELWCDCLSVVADSFTQRRSYDFQDEES